MNPFYSLHDKAEIEAYLRSFPHYNYYHLGDLDDFFWPHTCWFASKAGSQITALALLYTAPDPAVLLAILNENERELRALLESLEHLLPKRFYAHFSPGLESIFAPTHSLEHHGEHYQMTLTQPEALNAIDSGAAVPLGRQNLAQIEALYQAAYPGNWFDARMLETGQYVGIFSPTGALVCVAGVHVYSPRYRVAALGNITTHPDHRGQGLATAATAGLCLRLREHIDVIGLNVRTDNAPAIQAYRKIGFTVSTTYHEWMLEHF